jgi:ethanolamine phosphate transferase 2 subunit G
LFVSPSFPVDGSTIQSPIDPQTDFHYYTKIQQSDLVPTISTLLGWPIPRNNIGTFVRSFLQLWKGAPSHLIADNRCKVSVSGCRDECCADK